MAWTGERARLARTAAATWRARALVVSAAVLLASCSGYRHPGDGGERRTAARAVGLEDVLISASGTPAKQGYLFVAMVDAEVASQQAGRALAAGDDRGAVESAIGEMLFALDPAEAPAWRVKQSGIVAGWAGTGFGLRRSARAAAEEVRAAADDSAALAADGPRAAACIDNTLARADRLIALGQQALATGDSATLAPLLGEIATAAHELNRGRELAVGPSGDAGCGLQQAQGLLAEVVPAVLA